MKLLSRGLFPLISTLGVLGGCGDSCQEYSDYSCKQLERAEYNVYFYYPSGSEEYLGRATGLEQCGDVAYSFAASKKLSRYQDWSYICCLKTDDSECAEKHR